MHFSYPCLIALPRTYSIILNRSGKSGDHFFFPDLRRKAFELSPLRMMLAVVLSYIIFIMVRYVSSLPNLRIFILNGFVKCFFWFYWDKRMIFDSVNVMYPIDLFAYVETALHFRDESHLIMMNKPFHMLLNLVYQYFENFYIYIH